MFTVIPDCTRTLHHFGTEAEAIAFARKDCIERATTARVLRRTYITGEARSALVACCNHEGHLYRPAVR